MSTLSVGGAVARELELGRADLAAVATAHQVPDVGELVDDRQGTAVRLAALFELAQPEAAVRFVHVESADESFTANLPLEDALAGGLVLYALEGDDLPGRFGGPFRLLVADSDECSVNVKHLARVDFLVEPGDHTARCPS